MNTKSLLQELSLRLEAHREQYQLIYAKGKALLREARLLLTQQNLDRSLLNHSILRIKAVIDTIDDQDALCALLAHAKKNSLDCKYVWRKFFSCCFLLVGATVATLEALGIGVCSDKLGMTGCAVAAALASSHSARRLYQQRQTLETVAPLRQESSAN